MEFFKKAASIDIKDLKNAKAVKYPSKRTVNLAMRDTNNQDAKTLIIGIILIVIVCFLVVKFGISDQYARLSAAESEYAQVHTQYTEMQSSLKNYSQVEQEYHTYSRDWMTTSDGEADGTGVTVDRTDVLDLIEKNLMSYGNINSFRVDGSVVSVSMSGMNLSEISIMFSNLQAQDLVESANLNIASTQKSSDESLEFSITITLAQQEDDEAASEGAASGTAGTSGASGTGNNSTSTSANSTSTSTKTEGQGN
jgi:hypothetical protein